MFTHLFPGKVDLERFSLCLVIIKLGFSLFTKKGKERSCNTQRCVFIGELLIHNLETVDVGPVGRHSTG